MNSFILCFYEGGGKLEKTRTNQQIAPNVSFILLNPCLLPRVNSSLLVILGGGVENNDNVLGEDKLSTKLLKFI